MMMLISKFLKGKPSHTNIHIHETFPDVGDLPNCELKKDFLSDDDDRYTYADDKIYHISWAVFTHWSGKYKHHTIIELFNLSKSLFIINYRS